MQIQQYFFIVLIRLNVQSLISVYLIDFNISRFLKKLYHLKEKSFLCKNFIMHLCHTTTTCNYCKNLFCLFIPGIYQYVKCKIEYFVLMGGNLTLTFLVFLSLSIWHSLSCGVWFRCWDTVLKVNCWFTWSGRIYLLSNMCCGCDVEMSIV